MMRTHLTDFLVVDPPISLKACARLCLQVRGEVQQLLDVSGAAIVAAEAAYLRRQVPHAPYRGSPSTVPCPHDTSVYTKHLSTRNRLLHRCLAVVTQCIGGVPG